MASTRQQRQSPGPPAPGNIGVSRTRYSESVWGGVLTEYENGAIGHLVYKEYVLCYPPRAIPARCTRR